MQIKKIRCATETHRRLQINFFIALCGNTWWECDEWIKLIVTALKLWKQWSEQLQNDSSVLLVDSQEDCRLMSGEQCLFLNQDVFQECFLYSRWHGRHSTSFFFCVFQSSHLWQLHLQQANYDEILTTLSYQQPQFKMTKFKDIKISNYNMSETLLAFWKKKHH